jgi:subtilisin family serine protease
LAAAIANAVSQGIIVIFAAGNGQWGFPGQHPDVISAGGAYMKVDGSFEATPYASGFASRYYPGRNCPDVCGLVGLPPKAELIMLPVEDGDTIDTGQAGGVFPNGDETLPNDAWAAFSGTSAAAPQLAGVCALMKQACKRLTPSVIRDILKKTARDVTKGNCSPFTGGHAATTGPDLATGYGLADAYRATMTARLRCMIIPPIPIPVPIPGPVIPIPPTPIPGPVTPTPPIPPIPKPKHEEPAITEDELKALEDIILNS